MSDNIEIKDKLTDHDYDGIQEYDNPLPNWWLWVFFGTIIFGFIYWVHYEFGGGHTLRQELEAKMASLPVPTHAHVASESDESLEQSMKALGANAAGKALFGEKCAVCHGAEGQGLIGPNLTDNFWIHGQGTRSSIITVIREGVPDKGMPPWSTMIKPDEIMAVAAFVYNLKGTHPANPKAPQGNEIK